MNSKTAGIAADRAIPENIPAGITVGAPVSADGDEDLVYTLARPDAGSFDLHGDTGQIRTKDGVAYDYESRRARFSCARRTVC